MDKKSQLLLLATFILLTAVLYAQEESANFSVLKGPYLGQKPPGSRPDLFAPDLVSVKEEVHGNIVFSPDFTEGAWNPNDWVDNRNVLLAKENKKGKSEFPVVAGPYMGMKLPGKKPEKFPGEKYYRFFNSGKECYFVDNGIWYSKLQNGKWTEPLNTNIDYGKYADFEMNISPHGKKIFFNSIDRPLPEGVKTTDSQTWISDRKGDKWGNPIYPGVGGMYITSTADGTLYFTNTTDKPRAYIAKSRYMNGKYQREEIIPEPIFSETQGDMHPCIAPDESYLIFDSSREKINNCSMFISFKKIDGSWSDPINMGEYITQEKAAMATVTDDGRLILFRSKGIIWWVSAEIIPDLKLKYLHSFGH